MVFDFDLPYGCSRPEKLPKYDQHKRPRLGLGHFWSARQILVQSKWESPVNAGPGATHEKAKERRQAFQKLVHRWKIANLGDRPPVDVPHHMRKRTVLRAFQKLVHRWKIANFGDRRPVDVPHHMRKRTVLPAPPPAGRGAPSAPPSENWFIRGKRAPVSL
jgi:hypothetical protein